MRTAMGVEKQFLRISTNIRYSVYNCRQNEKIGRDLFFECCTEDEVPELRAHSIAVVVIFVMMQHVVLF
jgi:hypothetical protein